MRALVILFILTTLFLSTYYIDVWTNGNTTSRALPIVCWLENGSMKIDKYHEMTEDKAFVNGHYYTDKAPLPTFVVMPFFWALKTTGIIKADESGSYFGKHIYALGGFLTGSIPFVLILLLCFNKIKKLKTKISPILLASIPFFASFVFVFSGTYFAHILSGLFILLSYIDLRKEKYILSGIYAGLSFLCEYNHALIFLVWGVLIIISTKSIRPFIKYSLGILPSIIFIMIYNYVITGSPFDMLYKYHTYTEMHANYGFSHPTLEAFWGLTFSNYKGMLFYAPFLILVLYVFIKHLIKTQSVKIFKHYLVIPVILYFLMITTYSYWWGGWTYGPRFLTGITILLLYGGVIFIANKKFPKVWFWILTGFGLIGALLAKATVVYSVPSAIKRPFIDLILPNFSKGILNENNILSLFFSVSSGAAFYIYLALFILLIGLLHFYSRLEIKKLAT